VSLFVLSRDLIIISNIFAVQKKKEGAGCDSGGVGEKGGVIHKK
jgi:hypothetical protein